MPDPDRLAPVFLGASCLDGGTSRFGDSCLLVSVVLGGCSFSGMPGNMQTGISFYNSAKSYSQDRN